MIVDVHSHAWLYPQHFGADFRRQAMAARAGVEVDLTVRLADYRKTATLAKGQLKTIVFGGKARLSDLYVDDHYVAKYVSQAPKDLIGFLSVDPTEEDWYRQLREGHEQLGLRGIKLLPMYAGFDPRARRLDPLWRYAARTGLPVLLHTGTTFIRQAPLKFTLPRLLDDVAARFPEVKIILAHLSHPYEGECIVTIRKHPNVFADISALHYRPWQLFHSLMLVQEYGVWDKVLFGTDYPFTTVDATIRDLRTLSDRCGNGKTAALDPKQIENLIQRDSLRLLGLS